VRDGICTQTAPLWSVELMPSLPEWITKGLDGVYPGFTRGLPGDADCIDPPAKCLWYAELTF
jgi:hypothetical protein